MKVIASRDDGAILVVDGPAAAVVSDGQVWFSSRASATSKGVSWVAASGLVPAAVRSQVQQGLARLKQELEAGEMR